MRLRAALAPVVAVLVVAGLAASCGGGGGGPGGTDDVYLRCTPYYGDLCKAAMYPNFFQCDARPGDACVVAPSPSPDPNQTVWCCQFGCVRGDPARDFRCMDGRSVFYCNPDAMVNPASLGCVAGGDSNEICC
jgi:hypothetical protein